MPSRLKLAFSHAFPLENSIWSCTSSWGTQQLLHTAFSQSNGVSVMKGAPYIARQIKATRHTCLCMSVPQLLLSLQSGTGSKKVLFSDRVVVLSKLCSATATLLAALGSATQPHRFQGPWCRPTIHPAVGIPSCGFSPHHPLAANQTALFPTFSPTASHV